ncbi:hypothetical protein BDV12DRAFT_199668 [Aspergillus spectabilis]
MQPGTSHLVLMVEPLRYPGTPANAFPSFEEKNFIPSYRQVSHCDEAGKASSNSGGIVGGVIVTGGVLLLRAGNQPRSQGLGLGIKEEAILRALKFRSLGTMVQIDFVVTSASGGIGETLTEILYQHNLTIYLDARAKSKADSAISEITTKHPTSTGRFEYLHLDLGDLTIIKASATEFLAKEQRLDVLWTMPPSWHHQQRRSPRSDMICTQMAAVEKDSVRVDWVSSIASDYASHAGC